MLKTIALIVVLVLVVGIGGVLAYAATRPDTFTLQRSASIKASPDKIFPFLSDFHNWRAWSPWENKDPELKRTYSGAERGEGAVYAWVGNRNVGEGRMEITETAPSSRVALKLDFLKPFEAHNMVEFTLEPRGDMTDVTWRMHGPQPYFAKVIGVVFSMDKMVGKDFDIGLANLKAAAEK